ncbi:Fe-S cluster assembly protein SufD [Methylomagnum sp.]
MSYAEQFRDLAPILPGQDLPWLQALRREASERFAVGGFPSPREEEWKYTNVVALEKKLFKPASGAESGPVDMDLIERYRLNDAISLVFVDGIYQETWSDLGGLPDGVIVASLADALERCPERVEAHFNRIAAREEHGFTAFTTAYFRDGLFVHVPAGRVLTKPLQMLHISTRADGLSALRHLIVLDRNAEAQVVETYVGVAGVGYLTAAVTELSLGENAGLEHYKLQAETDKGYHFGGVYAEQARSARLRQHNAAFGGLLARTEIHSELRLGAECELDGLFLASGRRHLDTHTIVRHAAPNATTRETYRGIASGRGRGVFSGRIVVEKDAQKTDAEMSSRNLLLSDDAEIDSKPQLEIHADDVKCAHGVTVGQLDANAVFYLESRGIDEPSARNMLTFAFANELVDKIRLDGLKELVRAELLAALPQSDIRGDWL